MKKILMIFVGLIVVLGLIGSCSDEEVVNETQDKTKTTQEEQTTTKEVEKEEPKEEVSTEFENALNKAEIYAETMNMSKDAVKKQLVFEKFESDAIEYAMENLEADWNENALASAKMYIDTLSMSKASIPEQLQFEGFTDEQIDYAMENLE